MLAHLTVRDFRNLAHLDLDVPESGLVVVGENGHGKTNLLEAVAYLELLRSLRGARDQDVIRFGAAAFHVRATLRAPARVGQASVGYERHGKRKRATLDGVEQARLSDALGALPSVCFSPADVALVAGGPGERRRYLDVALALSSRAYLQALQTYRGALVRRNAALRSALRDGTRHAGSHDARVAVWEPALAEQGAVLAAARLTWAMARGDEFSALCAAIGERMTVTLRYGMHGAAAHGASPHGAPALGGSSAVSVVALRDSYQRAFDQQRGQELRRGSTLVGPHRDELQLLLDGRELRTFGSAGQQRTAAIALRMLESATLRDAMGATPILLLDDPFAELDARRSARILALLQEAGVGQVLLTVPRVEDIPRAFTRLERREMVDGEMSAMDPSQ